MGKRQPSRIPRAFLCAALGAASAMCFVVDTEGYVGMSALPAASTSYLWSALALCFALLLYHVHVRRDIRAGAGAVLPGLLFGVLNAFGGLLFAYDSWAMLASPATLALTLLRSAGQAVPMASLLAWVDAGLRGGALYRPGTLDDAPVPAALRPLRRWALRHETAAYMLMLALCWSPYLIAFYPGTVCWDLGEMVAQFFGQRPMDTWHPVFLTWVIGGCVWLGRLVGSDNLGAALYTLIQTALMAFALSGVLRLMRALRLNRAARLAAAAFFALLPIWGGYAQFISKDTLYTSALLLFALCLIRLVLAREGRPSDLPDALQRAVRHPAHGGIRLRVCGAGTGAAGCGRRAGRGCGLRPAVFPCAAARAGRARRDGQRPVFRLLSAERAGFARSCRRGYARGICRDRPRAGRGKSG